MLCAGDHTLLLPADFIRPRLWKPMSLMQLLKVHGLTDTVAGPPATPRRWVCILIWLTRGVGGLHTLVIVSLSPRGCVHDCDLHEDSTATRTLHKHAKMLVKEPSSAAEPANQAQLQQCSKHGRVTARS
jgi:hypothetical protein